MKFIDDITVLHEVFIPYTHWVFFLEADAFMCPQLGSVIFQMNFIGHLIREKKNSSFKCRPRCAWLNLVPWRTAPSISPHSWYTNRSYTNYYVEKRWALPSRKSISCPSVPWYVMVDTESPPRLIRNRASSAATSTFDNWHGCFKITSFDELQEILVISQVMLCLVADHTLVLVSLSGSWTNRNDIRRWRFKPRGLHHWYLRTCPWQNCEFSSPYIIISAPVVQPGLLTHKYISGRYIFLSVRQSSC